MAQSAIASSVAITSLSVEVVEYFVSDDPQYYQNHVFVLQVWVEQDLYEVQRSYAAFLDLDCRLRRKYPRSALPTLALAGAKDYSDAPVKHKRFSLLKGSKDKEREKDRDREKERTLSVSGSNNSSGRERTRSMSFSEASSLLHRDTDSLSISSHSKRNTQKLTKRTDSNEVIAQKKSVLTYYLADLLKIPEVLMSSTLLYFLDEESRDGDPVEECEDILENQDFLLMLEDEPQTVKTVRKDFKLSLSVDESDVVVWCFASKLRDIAFCLFCDEQEVEEYPYRRYNAQEYTIYGLYTARHAGKVDLVWDNSYSKFHSKTVIYAARVLKQEHYQQALVKSQELKEIKHKFAQSRKRVFKILQKLSLEVLQKNNALSDFSSLTITDKGEVIHEQSEDAPSLALREGGEETVFERENANTTVKLSTQQHTPLEQESSIEIEQEEDTQRERFEVIPPVVPYRRNYDVPLSKQVKDLQEQLDRMKTEKQYLQIAYTQCETALVAERSACAEKQQQCDDLQLAKDMLDEELDEAKHEVESLKTEYQELLTSRMTLSVALNDTHKLPIEELLKFPSNTAEEELLGKPEVALANFQTILNFARELRREFAEQHQAFAVQEQALAKSKAERKALKAAAIQLKEKGEQLEREKLQMEHDLGLIVTERDELQEYVQALQSDLESTKRESNRFELLLGANSLKEVAPIERIDSPREREHSQDAQRHDERARDSQENKDNKEEGEGDEDEEEEIDFSPTALIEKLSNEMPIEEVVDREIPAQPDNHSTGSNNSSTHGEEIASKSKKKIVIDFAKQEADEVSQYFSNIKSSFMVSWDSLIQSMEDHGTNSSHSSSTHSSAASTTNAASTASPVRPTKKVDNVPVKFSHVLYR